MDFKRLILRFRGTVWCNFLLFLSVILYSVISTYTTYMLMIKSMETTSVQKENIIIGKKEKQTELRAQSSQTLQSQFSKVPLRSLKPDGINEAITEVEIWGKAAIGIYLWKHIFDMELEVRLGGTWHYGSVVINGITFHFRTGPGVIPQKVPQNSKNVVLVINGREVNKINFARMWLDEVSKLPKLRNLGVVLLGNEQCNNEWLMPYMESNGGAVKFVHIVYDIPYADENTFYQWPLGVATYRGFPKFSSMLPLQNKRKYVCNFLGTVYKGSSRETFLSILKTLNESECYIKTRNEWVPNETDESLEHYISILQESDLTLNPVGMNTECYRIYEACALGSVPVIEDVMTPGRCGNGVGSSLKLLKSMEAPFIYIKDWSELSHVLENERKMTLQEKIKRRHNLLNWYNKEFMFKLRNQFLDSIRKKFK